MTELRTAILGIGVVGLAVGVAVSAAGSGKHDRVRVVASDVAASPHGMTAHDTYAFGFAVGSRLWSVTMRMATPVPLSA